MNLSERLRPGIEAAPWVIEEVKLLERKLEEQTIARNSDEGLISDLRERVRVLEEAMHAIGDACHELSSGPEVPDAFWDLRCTAYSALAGGKEEG